MVMLFKGQALISNLFEKEAGYLKRWAKLSSVLWSSVSTELAVERHKIFRFRSIIRETTLFKVVFGTPSEWENCSEYWPYKGDRKPEKYWQACCIPNYGVRWGFNSGQNQIYNVMKMIHVQDPSLELRALFTIPCLFERWVICGGWTNV